MNYRREKIIRIIVIIISSAIIIGITVFGFLGTFSDWGWERDKEYTGFMPNIVGYDYEQVRTAYQGWFDLEVTGEDYSDEFLEGEILSQDIAEGTEYTVGDATVKVTVSRGAKPAETTVTEVTVTEEIPTETETETEVPEEIQRVDGPIENLAAVFERSYPEMELELTAAGMEIPDSAKELADELYAVLRRHGAD
ncbi:MAG: PASTA domain-containing protein, partial [Oscillospiraceae bacterium]|nr:PASTA domain-containing protein [Oscillospiraceae bacterium]